MAATRLIAMHAGKGKTVSKSIKDRTDYAKNDEKTEEGKWISSYECTPETVDEEFMLSKQEYLRITGRQPKGDIIAYQIRQSFKPGEITPEEANRVGYETAMRFTKGNHAFIVATHTDREHIHNHVIFNSTTLDCTRKFRDFFFVGIALQRLSDLVCLEHGLSVIKPRKPGKRERENRYAKPVSFHEKICCDIENELEKKPKDFEELLRGLQNEGYEVKRGKYDALKGKGQKRFIRFRSLGEGYTKEDIKRRIGGELEDVPYEKKWKKRMRRPGKKWDLLIDIQEKIKQGKGGGYTQWAKVFNVKQMAQVLLFLQEKGIRDYDVLAERASNASEHFRKLSKEIKADEKRLAEITDLKKHIINYAKTREVYIAYRNSGYSKKFYEEHMEDIILHKAAKEAFTKLQVTKIPRVKELNEEYAQVLEHKQALYGEYRDAKKEMQEYVTAKHNVDAFFAKEREENIQKAEQKRRENTIR